MAGHLGEVWGLLTSASGPRDAIGILLRTLRRNLGIDRDSATQTEDLPDRVVQRPRPSVAPRLLAAEAARTPFNTGRDKRVLPSRAPLSTAYYDVDSMDTGLLSGPSDTEHHIHRETSGSEDASPQSRHQKDPDSEEADSLAGRLNITDVDDIDLRFGAQMGNAGPENRTPADTTLQSMHGRPKAAAKLLVRSGLRRHRCHLKAWVCLCDRAPVELDRRGTAPSPSERYPFSRMHASSAVVTFHILDGVDWHAALSGPTRFLQHRWWAETSEFSARHPHALLSARPIPAGMLAQKPITEQYLMHYSYSELHPNPKRILLPPIRGPKSAPSLASRVQNFSFKPDSGG